MASFDYENVLGKVRALDFDLRELDLPPEAGAPSVGDAVIYFSIVRGTRGYIEQIAHQINGTYEHGWYDACAVMIRRLIETMIIEAFEGFGIANTIQNATGDFFHLGDLISAALAEPSWNLGRNTKKALRSLKDVGDRSAHSRRFVAQRKDIDKVSPDLRVAVQELVYLAGLK